MYLLEALLAHNHQLLREFECCIEILAEKIPHLPTLLEESIKLHCDESCARSDLLYLLMKTNGEMSSIMELYKAFPMAEGDVEVRGSIIGWL